MKKLVLIIYSPITLHPLRQVRPSDFIIPVKACVEFTSYCTSCYIMLPTSQNDTMGQETALEDSKT